MALTPLTNLFPTSFLNDSSLEKSLGEEFALCENGNMVFHWADFHETCDAIKENMQSDPGLAEDYKRREAAIAMLALIPLWIRTQSKVYQMTMHDLYQRYIMNQSHQIGGPGPFDPIEISFISGTGPFKGMAIAECFNNITYRDFVLINLLKGKLPKRDFRIRLKAKVLVEHGKEFAQARLVNLEQMTLNGLLFSVESDFFIQELSQGSGMRVLIDTNFLKEGMNKSVTELQAHLSQHSFNLMYSSRKEDAIECFLENFTTQSSFDFFKNKKVFLFTTYEKLGSTNPRSAKILQDFVTYARELVREHYKDVTKKMKSA